MPSLKNYALAGLIALCAVLFLGAYEYRRMFKATDFALKTQNEAIKAQNKTAEDTLKRLTTERDALQKTLDTKAAAQEKTDEKGKAAVAADSARDASVPVRVRYVSVPSGCGGGSPAGGAAAPAQDRPGDAGTTSGVLAPAAQKQFGSAVDDIETLQLAYNSCRARVVKE